MARQEITTVAATRPCRGETANGDAWRADRHQQSWRIAIIDALGHGPIAAEIAIKALEALAAAPALGPVEALHACHGALAGTRGAALGVARIDLLAGSLTYAAIGNIEAQLRTPDGEQRLIAYRGIVGSHMRTVRSFELPLPSEWLLFMHTDGIPTRFTPDTALSPSASEAQRLVEGILAQYGLDNDDATIVLAWPFDAS